MYRTVKKKILLTAGKDYITVFSSILRFCHDFNILNILRSLKALKTDIPLVETSSLVTDMMISKILKLTTIQSKMLNPLSTYLLKPSPNIIRTISIVKTNENI